MNKKTVSLTFYMEVHQEGGGEVKNWRNFQPFSSLAKSLAFAAIYWSLATVFASGDSLWHKVFPQNIPELCQRLSAIAIIIAAGIYFQTSKNKDRCVLEKATKEIENFAYAVSHDLKSPAIGVHGLTNLLKKRCYEKIDERDRLVCDQIMKAAQYICTLVDNINVFIKTREVPLTIEPVDIQAILRSLREELLPVMAERRIEFFIAENIPTIRADQASMQRIFRNLLDNALKYGGDSLSRIAVHYEENGKDHTFSFQDDGTGIHAKHHETIFEPFLRVKSTAGINGSGLGLSIVKELVEKHSGRIWVDPASECGTTFRLAISKKL